MSCIHMKSLSGGTVKVSTAVLEALRARLGGSILQPGDADYDQARAVWNAMVDKRPRLIVRCTRAADIMEVVRFAHEHDLLLSVRSGGHNIAGTALCDGGLMIDLSPMKGVSVDPATCCVRVQPGATWGDVDRETQRFGFAVPSGIVSTTGVSGLTLGGGFGWLSRKYAFTCDNLVGVDIVTADGTLRRASDKENSDLFWAVRGGGGNFGIVATFEFQARSVGPQVLAGLRIWPFDEAPAVLALFRDLTTETPDELGTLPMLRRAPAAPFLPPEVHGRLVAGIAVCYAGPIEEGEHLLRPLREFGRPIADLIGPKPFMAHQQMLDAAQPPGRYYYWKSEYLHRLDFALDEILVRRTQAITSPLSSVLIMQLGGAIDRMDSSASAVAHRDARYVLNIAASWTNPAEADIHIQWTRAFWEDIRPFSTGGNYVNFLGADEPVERVRAAYGPASYDRLLTCKAKYDPRNLFRVNQNIRPAA